MYLFLQAYKEGLEIQAAQQDKTHNQLQEDNARFLQKIQVINLYMYVTVLSHHYKEWALKGCIIFQNW